MEHKLTQFMFGADSDSEKWDNRKNAPWRARPTADETNEAANAQAMFVVEHSEILNFLRGFQ